MRILLLGKRFSSGKDCILDDFGREVRLAEQLQLLGCSVVFFAADFHKKGSFNSRLHGIDVKVRPFSVFSLPSYLFRVICASFKTDAILAMGDPISFFLGFVASLISRKPLICDIRDNYETYESMNVPGIRFFHKLALRKASAVTAISSVLASNSCSRNAFVLGNGVDPGLFRPISMTVSRRRMNLPLGVRIISYMGSSKIPGTDDLVAAFRKLLGKDKDLFLFLLGNFDVKGKHIIVRKPIPYDELPYAVNSANALVIPYHLTPFTSVMYSTYKLAEFMACNRPIVCTDVGEMPILLKRELVVPPGDVDKLAVAIGIAMKIRNIDYRRTLFMKGLTWKLLGKRFYKIISDSVRAQ